MPRVRKEITVPPEDAMGDDTRARVAWAGLLADQPNLRDEEHTVGEWQELLDAYNTSERI